MAGMRARVEQVRARALTGAYQRLARPVLFRAFSGNPETVHEATVEAAADLWHERRLRVLTPVVVGRPATPVTVAGIRFPGVVGLAAGMDKDGMALRTWERLGFGHVELGTVTPRPQPGNPTPRVFRLRHSEAIINRMGFNNDGVEALATRLREARADGAVSIPLGVSIGKNRTTELEHAVDDYLTCLSALTGLADYVAVNISSPNTPGLRGLQDAGPLRELLGALAARARELAPVGAAPVPIFVKLAPDLTPEARDEAVGVAESTGMAGIIAGNTTLSREGLELRDAVHASEPGGLSGAPLTVRARATVAELHARTALPIIGVGGIMRPDDALRMLDAGASLVQVYTGLVYSGPGLVAGINAAVRR